MSGLASRRTRTARDIQQHDILDRLYAAFPDGHNTDPKGKAKAKQLLDDSTWSPADNWAVESQIKGLADKHAINLSYELATALQRTYAKLKTSAQQSVQLTQQARQVQHARKREFASGDGRRPSASTSKQAALDTEIQDPWITTSNLPDMVQLLIALSHPPDVTTHTFAHLLLDPVQSRKTTYLSPEQRQAAERAVWNRILLDEPLDDPEWDEAASDTSELSLWSDLSQADRTDAHLSDDSDREERLARRNRRLQKDRAYNEELSAADQLARLQQADWQAYREQRALFLSQVGRDAYWSNPQGPISEVFAVREALLALQGLPGFLFRQQEPHSFTLAAELQSKGTIPNATMTGQLKAVATTATILLQLRAFVRRSQHTDSESTGSKVVSLEAFAESVLVIIDRLGLWCSGYDADLAASLSHSGISSEELPRRDRVATLAALCSEADSRTASLRILHQLLSDLDMLDQSDELVTNTSVLLDGLQALLGFGTAQGTALDASVQRDVADCFLATAEPWWAQACSCIRDGLNFDLARPKPGQAAPHTLVSHEALVEANPSLQTRDSRFWQEGFGIRRTAGQTDANAAAIPAFLRPLVHDVLNAAKTVGLLRTLGVDLTDSISNFATLSTLLATRDIAFKDSESVSRPEPPECDTVAAAQALLRNALFSLSTVSVAGREGDSTTEELIDERLRERLLEPQMSRTLISHLETTLAAVRKQLQHILISPWQEGGCDLLSHLAAIQGLYLMRRGPEMSAWCKLLFGKLSEPEHSAGLAVHQLNASFRDAALPNSEGRDRQEGWATRSGAWIDASLVRFHMRRMRRSDKREEEQGDRAAREMELLGSVRVEYQVPWPVSYCLTPDTMLAYQDIFSLLVRAKRARRATTTLLKTDQPDSYTLRKFWALRRRADWIVRVLEEYLFRDVIGSVVPDLSTILETVSTFDELIGRHVTSVGTIEYLCFLQEGQEDVSRSMEQILTLSVEIIDTFETAFSADSRVPRRRRQRRRRDEETDSEDDGHSVGEEGDEEVDRSVTWMGDQTQRREQFRTQLARQTRQLERLVERLRTGVEEQIGKRRTMDEARERLQELVYALDDWRS